MRETGRTSRSDRCLNRVEFMHVWELNNGRAGGEKKKKKNHEYV